MKIKFTYYQYKSKLATFVSMLKSGIVGFSVWLFAFFIPAFIICMACGASGAVIGGVLGGAFGLALITYIIFCFTVDEEKINEKYLKKKGLNKPSLNISFDVATEILRDMEGKKAYRRDTFCEHLLLIVSEFANKNLLFDVYDRVEDKIKSDIASRFRISEAMFGDFYVKDDINNKKIVKSIEEFSFRIGIYYLFEFDLEFSDIKTGDILTIIGEYKPEQFSTQMSPLDDSIEHISRDDLVERIKTEL